MSKPKFRLSLALALAVAVSAGFAAGIVGELWINQFLAPEIQFKDYRDLTKRLDDLAGQQKKELKDLLTEQDRSINKIVEQVQPAIVGIYKYKAAKQDLDSIYSDNEVLGSGFILTGDGWIITSQKVIADDYRYAVRVNNDIYPVEKIVPDSITDLVFIKINHDKLPVVDLGARNQLYAGQSLIAAAMHQGAIRITVNDLYQAKIDEPADLLIASESFYRYISVSGEFDARSIGAPVFNLSGQVAGILINEQGLVLPTDYFSRIIKSAVQAEAVERVYLGVNYLDLQLSPNYGHKLAKGALLANDGKRAAVVPGSPAERAGLRKGDVILKVENEEVNKFQSLSELIQDYSAGTKVNLTVWRQDQEKIITVELKPLEPVL